MFQLFEFEWMFNLFWWVSRCVCVRVLVIFWNRAVGYYIMNNQT